MYFRKLLSYLILFFTAVIIMISSVAKADSAYMEQMNRPNQTVIEYIQLSVSSSNRQAWLEEEKQTWEPWLKKQPGFLSRQLFWDSDREEATLMISWASREKWKSIPQSEIDLVQKAFETCAREQTGSFKGNPFPLKLEAELLPQ